MENLKNIIPRVSDTLYPSQWKTILLQLNYQMEIVFLDLYVQKED